MQNRPRGRLFRLSQLAAAFALSTLLFAPGCSLVHQQVETEKLLAPLADANTADLIATVNKLVGVRSLRGRVDIQFEDTSFATSGIAEKYRTADGSIIVERPGKVYLVIQGPLAIDIAQMTSDGEHFRIAILKGDEKYRRFVMGTNNASYPKLDAESGAEPTADKKAKRTSEAQTVNALSNLRPQHLTAALMLSPIDPRAAGIFYAQSEFFESEKDPTKGSKKRVVRGYYFLDEFQTGTDNTARLLRRFWFDRVGGIRLARLQSFDDKGTLVNDVSYGPLVQFGTEQTVQMPAKVSLTRPQDHYKITITYQAPEAIVIDREYPADVFVLTNKWPLPEVDLDKKTTTAPPKN